MKSTGKIVVHVEGLAARWPLLAGRDPGLTALRSATRSAVVMPSVWAFAAGVSGSTQFATFALFGAITLAIMVEFGGATRSRLAAYLALAGAGTVSIVLGTWCSHDAWLAAVATAVVAFALLLSGAINGYFVAGAPSALLTFIRTLYDSQEFNFAGPYGRNGFLEDYTARVDGELLGNVVLVTRNGAGQARHIVANYRPRDTLLRVSRLIGDHFAGTSIGEHFVRSGG